MINLFVPSVDEKWKRLMQGFRKGIWDGDLSRDTRNEKKPFLLSLSLFLSFSLYSFIFFLRQI